MMPTISQFYGIRIVMFLKQKEHNPTHIRAYYGGGEAKLVKEFIFKNKKELMEMWDSGIYKKLPPIE